MHNPVSVNVLAQDQHGFMWLGTDEGLFRFNGRTFTAFADTVRQPITALGVYSGTLWIGYKNGVLAYMGRDGLWQRYRGLNNHTAITGIMLKHGAPCLL